MAFLNEVGLQTFWNNCKAKFGNKLTRLTTTTTVTINLETSESNNLSSVSIPPASAEEAGVMVSADKVKLDGVATGATANIGTITKVSTSAPLTGGGSLGAVTVAHGEIGTAGTYGSVSTNELAPEFGSTFSVPGFTTNTTGHVESAKAHNVKIPATEATEAKAGLLSASDKTKLNGIAQNATANTPANALPLNVSTSSAVGTSTLYARQDHVHNIDLATGDSNGQIKIAGTNVNVKGLSTSAYKGIDETLSSSSTNSNVPTSKAVFNFVDDRLDNLAITKETIDLICVANTVH